MRSPFVTVGLAASLLLSAHVGAQTQAKNTMWPTDFGAGTFRRAVAGRWLDDLRTHVVVRRGSALYFAFDPGTWTGLIPLGLAADATDLVTLPGSAADGRDQLLVTTGLGATLGTVDLGLAAFTFTPVLDQDWNGATGLTARRVPNGSAVIAAIAADGETVRTARISRGGQPLPGPSMSVGAAIAEVEVMDWDEDGEVEIVAMAADGIHSFELDGTPRALFAATIENSVCTVITHAVQTERLACVGEINGQHYVFVLNENVFEPAIFLDVGAAGIPTPMLVTGLAASDMDGDGDMDLLLSQRSSHDAIVIPRGEPKVFELVPLTSDSRGDPTDNHCPAVWTDLDHDDVPDAVFFRDSDDNMLVIYSIDCVIEVGTQEDIVREAKYDGTTLRLDVPQSFGENTTHLDVIAWHQPDPFGPNVPPVDPSGVLKISAALSTLPTEADVYQLSFELTPPLTTSVSPYWSEHDHFYLELRFYDPDEKEVGHSEVVGFTIKEASGVLVPTFMGYLYTLEGEDWNEVLVFPNQPPGLPRPEEIGGIILRKEPPPFGDGPIPTAS